MKVPSPGRRHNYHECNKAALPGLGAVHVYVVMHHTKPGMWQLNLFFVSSAITCGMPFQTIGRDLYQFLEALDYRCLADAQAFSTFPQFFHPILQVDHPWVCLVLLQREIILITVNYKVAHSTLEHFNVLGIILTITELPLKGLKGKCTFH